MTPSQASDGARRTAPDMWTRYVVVGGAGFIGGHFVDRLLGAAHVDRVTVFDNFSSGRDWHLEAHAEDPRLVVVRGDVHDALKLGEAVAGQEVLIHLASNPDIARAATEPAVDFDEGTVLTHNIAEACRQGGVQLVLYASGSGVYGDIGETEAFEDFGPLLPVSTYGASKLAGEAILASYCFMFDLRARAFRFGNVVGPRQTHGVGFDFLRRLREDPSRLAILGDGKQSKSYIHVDDVIDAVLLAAGAVDEAEQPYDVFNVATGDYITVAEIADLALDVLGLDPEATVFEFTGGDRGWRGDVPVVRIATEKIRVLGWENRWSSAEALRRALEAMLVDARAGRL